MLFVNDCAGVKEIPNWLRHAHVDEDMMGFPDTIFPAFLFCVGMSTYVSIQQRLLKGDDWRSIIGHIFWRTIALLTMGLFALNMQELPYIPQSVFEILMVAGFFLTWNVSPSRTWRKILKWAGMLLLISMVIACDLWGTPFHTGWWGILGLIGWTYLVCCIIFIISKGNLTRLTVSWILILFIALLSNTKWIPNEYFSHVLTLPFIPGGWGHHAIGVSGMVAVALMLKLDKQPRTYLLDMLLIGLIFLLFGYLAHRHWIICKIHCTPTWVYFCLSIYFPIMGVLHWLADIGKKDYWFRLLRPAATATLTCYTLPYLVYPIMQLFGWWYPEVMNCGIFGIIRSACFAMFVIGIVSIMQRKNLMLKI